MKANKLSCKDLMVGDWVYCRYLNEIVKVTALLSKPDDTYRIIVIGNDAVEKVFREKHIEPIPLTAEILGKNGFKLNPQGSYSIGRNISIDMLDGRYNANMNTNSPQAPSFLYLVGKYVHELQHALRLCGIKKEIKL